MTSAGRESEVPPHSFAGVGGVGRAKMGCQRTCLTREPNGHKMWAMKDKHTKLGVSTDRRTRSNATGSPGAQLSWGRAWTNQNVPGQPLAITWDHGCL